MNKVPVGMLNKLSKIVVEHGGSIVSSEDAASHIIDWNEDVDSNPDNTDDFIRILEVRGTPDVALASPSDGSKSATSALVHWWYYPDSYNEWIPDTEFSASDAPDLASLHPPTRSKWYVCCRFILDCDIFNEWGNPVDYEIENETPPGAEETDLVEEGTSAAARGASTLGSGKKARGRKRFSQLAGSGAQERAVSAKDVPVLGALTGTEKLLPDAVPPSLRPDVATTVLELAATGNGSSNKLQANGAVVAGSKRKAEEASLEDPVSPTGEPAWFSHSAVSEFEEQVLGTTCTADSADYLKIRNGVLALCAQSPLQYITGTECRRKLPGDVSKILQVHEFLNAFALINSRGRRDARPDAPVSVLASSIACLNQAQQRTRRGIQAVENDVWSAGDDADLTAAVQVHRSLSSPGEVDWSAVANCIAGARKSPAECAARFVGLDLQQGETASGGREENNSLLMPAETLLAAVRQFSAVINIRNFNIIFEKNLWLYYLFVFRTLSNRLRDIQINSARPRWWLQKASAPV